MSSVFFFSSHNEEEKSTNLVVYEQRCWIWLRAISSTAKASLLWTPPPTTPHHHQHLPIWRHGRWAEVCDLLRQFCAWLPRPVLVRHLLLLVGLYPDLHTGLVYSCLATKYKIALSPAMTFVHAHRTCTQTFTHRMCLQFFGWNESLITKMR